LEDRLAPVQRVIANGCNPNRDTLELIKQAGFQFEHLVEVVEKGMPASDRATAHHRERDPAAQLTTQAAASDQPASYYPRKNAEAAD